MNSTFKPPRMPSVRFVDRLIARVFVASVVSLAVCARSGPAAGALIGQIDGAFIGEVFLGDQHRESVPWRKCAPLCARPFQGLYEPTEPGSGSALRLR